MKAIETNCHLQYQTVPITRNQANYHPSSQSRVTGVAERRLAVVALPPEFIYVLGVSD